MPKLLPLSFLVVVFLLNAGQSVATSLVFSDDITVTGASSLLVGTERYDVSFVPGNLYSTLPDKGFIFDAERAELAAQSLIDQVFSDVFFLTTPYPSISGITKDTLYGNSGWLQTNFLDEGSYPCYSIQSDIIFGWPEIDGLISTDIMGHEIFGGPSNAPELAYTVWTSSETDPVPEPSTFLLLSSGLVGLAWYRRKRKGE